MTAFFEKACPPLLMDSFFQLNLPNHPVAKTVNLFSK